MPGARVFRGANAFFIGGPKRFCLLRISPPPRYCNRAGRQCRRHQSPDPCAPVANAPESRGPFRHSGWNDVGESHISLQAIPRRSIPAASLCKRGGVHIRAVVHCIRVPGGAIRPNLRQARVPPLTKASDFATAGSFHNGTCALFMTVTFLVHQTDGARLGDF